MFLLDRLIVYLLLAYSRFYVSVGFGEAPGISKIHLQDATNDRSLADPPDRRRFPREK